MPSSVASSSSSSIRLPSVVPGRHLGSEGLPPSTSQATSAEVPPALTPEQERANWAYRQAHNARAQGLLPQLYQQPMPAAVPAYNPAARPTRPPGENAQRVVHGTLNALQQTGRVTERVLNKTADLTQRGFHRFSKRVADVDQALSSWLNGPSAPPSHPPYATQQQPFVQQQAAAYPYPPQSGRPSRTDQVAGLVGRATQYMNHQLDRLLTPPSAATLTPDQMHEHRAHMDDQLTAAVLQGSYNLGGLASLGLYARDMRVYEDQARHSGVVSPAWEHANQALTHALHYQSVQAPSVALQDHDLDFLAQWSPMHAYIARTYPQTAAQTTPQMLKPWLAQHLGGQR